MNLRLFLAKAARWLLLLALDRGLKQALPKIYKRLDAELPFWVNQQVMPQTIEGVIAQAASDALGRSPEPFEMSLVRLLYDPVAAAAGATRAWERRRTGLQ